LFQGILLFPVLVMFMTISFHIKGKKLSPFLHEQCSSDVNYLFS
jgi:hypothetical protein